MRGEWVYSTQEDPIGLAGGLNLYGYGEGDPVNYSDPFGLCPPETSDISDCTGAEGTSQSSETQQSNGSESKNQSSVLACAARGREQFQDGMDQLALDVIKPAMAVGAAWATGKVFGVVPLPARMQIGSVPPTWGGGEGARLVGGTVPRTATKAARFMNPSYIARYAVGGTLRAAGAVGAGLTFGQYVGTALICSINSNSYK